MSWGASITGLGSTLDLLDSIAVNFDNDVAYVVGPTVEYAIYVDQGTSRMEGRPFAQPAAERVQANLSTEVSPFLDESLIEAGEDGVVRAAALAVQREMQRIITEKGAVDTGTLRASVTVSRIN